MLRGMGNVRQCFSIDTTRFKRKLICVQKLSPHFVVSPCPSSLSLSCLCCSLVRAVVAIFRVRAAATAWKTSIVTSTPKVNQDTVWKHVIAHLTEGSHQAAKQTEAKPQMGTPHPTQTTPATMVPVPTILAQTPTPMVPVPTTPTQTTPVHLLATQGRISSLSQSRHLSSRKRSEMSYISMHTISTQSSCV